MQPTTPDTELSARIREASPDRQAIARWLDDLTHDDRVTAIRGTGRRDQQKLYELVQGFAPVRLAELVPAARPAMTTVRHYGRNTLPAFTHFEKRFCRPEGGDPEKPDELYGFNFQTMSPLTGPGYFIAAASAGAADEVLVDYRQLPPAHPPEWPEIVSNERGLSRFVYGFMVDTLRRVSQHVTIGSAARKGKDMGSWFLLCAEG